MKKYENQFELTLKNIDNVVQEIVTILADLNLDRKKIIPIRLSLEDALSRFYANNPEKLCTITFKSSFGRPVLVIACQGDPFNPLDESDDELNFTGRLSDALNDNGFSTEYKRKSSQNLVLFYLPVKKLNPLVKNFIAIAAAVVFSLLAVKILGHENSIFMVDNILDPAFSAFISLLSAVASFMIFLSILSSIINMGDISTFGKYGKKCITILLTRFFLMGLLCIAVCTVFLNILGSDVSISGSALTDFYKTIIAIVPSDLVSPFMTKNTLQITFIAGCFGLIILLADSHCKNVIQFINDMNILIAKSVSLLCGFMPLCIFLSLSKLFIIGDFSKILQIWKFFILIVGIGLFNSIASIVYTSLKHKISFLQLMKDSFLTGLAGFITASSFACYDSLHEFTVEKNNVDQKNFEFTFSMINVFCKLSVIVCLVVESLVLTDIYGISFSPVKLLIMFFTLLLTAISVPPVPGGSLAVWASILAMCGIPSEALGVVIAMDPFEDMIDTGFHVTTIGSIIIHADRKLKE